MTQEKFQHLQDDDASNDDEVPLPADFILRDDWQPVVRARAGAVSAQQSGLSDKNALLRTIELASPLSGGVLQGVRKLAQVSLDELNLRTKIPLKYLVAIEENRSDDLPAPIYLRGFLLAYLKYLGIQDQDVLETSCEKYMQYLRNHSHSGRLNS